MGLGFGGEVADYYARYRRGYPPTVVDVIAQAFNLGPGDWCWTLGAAPAS